MAQGLIDENAVEAARAEYEASEEALKIKCREFADGQTLAAFVGLALDRNTAAWIAYDRIRDKANKDDLPF